MFRRDGHFGAAQMIAWVVVRRAGELGAAVVVDLGTEYEAEAISGRVRLGAVGFVVVTRSNTARRRPRGNE
ncbi:hypothetical protein [Nocardia pseudobrasiliensis]|uniref:Uncharacterized protein n=1 Tax=Nocardia pseudobrasiliensis TaxID=45979 RepID=A0A370IA59_9NOCA|nr:hypothetical protein [Nocardia pseudobrasiliensis]RDI67597.1 hypothetical protein DFR76_103668 [Nocardia pseudobrasiliensis]